MKKILEYLKNLFSGSDEASSKRLLSIASFTALIVYIFVRDNTNTVDFVVYTLATLALGNQALTVFKKNSNEE